MNKLLSAVLAAGVLLSPSAFAQNEATPLPGAGAAPNQGAAAPAEGAAPPAEGAAAPAATPAAPAEGAAPAAEGEAAPAAEGAAEPASPEQAGAPAEDAVGSAEEAAGPAEGVVGGHAGEEGEHDGETAHYPLIPPKNLDWSFSGPFGHWDVGQLQRGFKVYREVCASCHSMSLVAFRNIEALGYNEAQVKALAAEYTVQDGPNSDGEMFERNAIASDRFPAPYPNAEAAAASNNGAVPPDLSLIAKARGVERGFPTFVFDIFAQYAEAGPDYIYSLLTGYDHEPPAGLEIQDGTYYNPYFVAGPALAMPKPIDDGQVTYDDGAPETLDQYSRDVSAFLMWASEPHMIERKHTGFVVMIFLIALSVLLFLTKRKVWNDTPH